MELAVTMEKPARGERTGSSETCVQLQIDHRHRIKLLEPEKTQMSVRSTKALFDRVWRLRHRAVM